MTLDIADFFSVPFAPSSTIIRSASAKAAPISEAPSISNAPISTLFAVDMVANLVSTIAASDATLALTTALAANWSAPIASSAIKSFVIWSLAI